MTRSQDPGAAAVGSFDAQGSLKMPQGYRRWVHIGTRLKPRDQHSRWPTHQNTGNLRRLRGAARVRTVPQNWAMARRNANRQKAWRCTHWSGLRPGDIDCRSPIGAGIFESDFAGLGMMVKDDKRFSDAPGHWGCFSFGQRPPRTLTLHCDRKTPAKPVTSLSHPGQTM
jgi:hypothetical protein